METSNLSISNAEEFLHGTPFPNPSFRIERGFGKIAILEMRGFEDIERSLLMEENMPVREGNNKEPSRISKGIREESSRAVFLFERNFQSIFMEFIGSIAKVIRNRNLV